MVYCLGSWSVFVLSTHTSMKRISIITTCCLAFALFCFSDASLSDETASAKPQIGPGTLITIPPEVDYNLTNNRADMVEVLATLPDVDPELVDDVRFNPEIWAKEVRYTRDVWCLQFSFKPVRIIYVDIPNKQGSFDKKAVWYMVYNVKNVGPADLDEIVTQRTITTDDGDRTYSTTEYDNKNPGGSIGTTLDTEYETPVAKDTEAVSELEPDKRIKQTRDAALVLREMPGTFKPRAGDDKPIQFVPQFILATESLVLESKQENNPETGKLESTHETTKVVYPDQIIPIALGPIMKREGMKAMPKTTVSITKEEIESGKDVWGVAMWTDIDPRISKFSIFVRGLSNEYRWKDSGNTTGKPGEGRSMEQKVLKTNWWRRGDKFNVNDTQIQYGQPGTVDYEWIFR